MFKKIGWTCTCVVRQTPKGFWSMRFLEEKLVRFPEDVKCHESYWNHDENGHPVQVEVGWFDFNIIGEQNEQKNN